MAESIFDKWNAEINGEELVKGIKEVAENGQREIPDGEYVVKIEKMELRESKNGKPKISIQFRIQEGEFKKSCLFWNQVVREPFQFHIANEFLKSLDTEVTVEFNGNYGDYNDMILDIFDAVDHEKLEFLLSMTENKGYKNFKIKEVYG